MMPSKQKISEILKHNPMSGRGGDMTISEQVVGPTLFKLSPFLCEIAPDFFGHS